MALEIKTLTLGELQTNCYLAWCSETQKAVVIDPADSGEVISEQILELQLELEAIVLTHGHFDHCLGLLALALNFPVPIYVHPADNSLLARAQKSGEFWLKHPVDPVPPATDALHDGQIIQFGNCSLVVLETPGHTPGSVCLYTKPEESLLEAEYKNVSEEPILFSGDTIFFDTIGRTDLRYSNKKQLFTSLRKLKELPSNTQLYSGHGEVGYLHSNPVFS